MFCQNCGTEINEETKFCPNCGKAVGSTQAEISQQVSTYTVQDLLNKVKRKFYKFFSENYAHQSDRH